MTCSDARVKEEQMSAAQSRIVPRERWAEFFEELSRTFHHRSTTIELVAQVQRPEVVASDQPLEAVTAGGKGQEAITIQLGERFNHTIDAPSQVRVQPYAAGPGQIVEIEGASAPVTRLYLAGPEEVGGSAGAAGGSVAGSDGTGGDGGLSAGDSSITFGSSDDMGGVASVGGGSIGEQDLSGRRGYDITDDVYGDLGLDPDALTDSAETSASVGQSSSGAGGAYVRGAGATGHGGRSDADVVDGGAGQGVIDRGIDPIEGPPIDAANDATDSYVEGDVGAQAERDLDNLERTRRAPRRKSSDTRAGKK
jgi:hypothetical protein